MRRVAKGMAIEVTQATVNAIAQGEGRLPFNLATGVLERLRRRRPRVDQERPIRARRS